MNKFFRILEITWLIVAISTGLISVYFLLLKDQGNALFFVFTFIIASIMYLLRKYQRKNQQKVNEHNAKLK
jgi:hypothetical protein